MIKAMVVERNDFWYMDDGDLTFTLCEDNRLEQISFLFYSLLQSGGRGPSSGTLHGLQRGKV